MKLKLTLIAGFIIMMAAGSGGALTPVREWGNTGKVISNNQGPAVQVYPAACRTSDGYTIVAWADERGGDLANGYYQVYVQKLDSNGIGSWNTAEAGVAIATAYATVGSGMIENYKICIVPDSAGGAIVSWLDQRSGVAIYAQRVDGNGTVQWTAGGIPVVTNSAGYSTVNSFRMTADGSGGIIICWGDDRNQQSKYDLYAQKIGSNGSLAWSANGVELYSSPYSKTFQQLVSDGTGGAVVASIVATDGTGSDIITLNITSAGTIAWVSTVCQAANDEANPQIVGSGTDKYIITWEDNRLMASGDSNIYAQALNGYGTAEWAANGVSICSDLNTAQTKPSIIADGSGGAVITWHDGRGNDIYAQRVNGSGEAQWTVDGVAVCSSTVYQTAPQIVGTGSGGSIIFWPDTRNDTSGFNYSEIFAQKLNGSGAAQWTANGIKFSGNTKQYFYSEFLSAPVEDGSGGALIFWTDINTDTNGDIYGTKATNDGTAAWGSSGEAICAAKKSVDQDQPVLSQDGLVIAWRDAKNGQTDIYAQKIDPATGNSLWAATDVAVATGAGTRNLGGIRRTSDGKYAVVWEDQRNASSDIYLQYLNSADGASLLTANGFRVTSSSNNEIQPAVAPDDNGGVVVTWQNSGGGGIGLRSRGPLLASAYVSDTSDLPNLDNMLFALGVGGDAKLIYAKRVGSDGSFTWADAASTAAGLGLLVSTYTDVDHPSLALTYPSVANIGGGSALVAWTDNRNDTVDGTTDIYGQKLALADGSLQWAGAGLPVCIATGNQTYPRAAKIADGVSIVTWTDARAGRGRGTLTDIYAQKLDAAGAAQWTENGVDVIIGTGNNTYSLPHAAVDSTSGYSFINMVADNGAGTYGNLIQVLDGNGAKLLTDPFQVVTSSDLKNYPDVAAIGSGAAILTWDTDIYSQKISGLGAPPAPEPTPAPSAPSNFSGTALSQNSIRWTWQDNATDESSCVLFNSGGTAIATVGASVTSHDESGLLSNTSYSRSVKAFNANGYSNSSNTKETYTMAGVPTELATTAATIAALTFSWNGDGTKYSVERSASQGGSWSYLAGDSFSNAISVKNYTDSNLTQNTAYWYRIRAYNGDGVRTDPSSEKEFTTLQAVVIQEPTITQVNPAMRFLSTQSQTGTFSINGSNFRSGATLTLKKSGQADIQAENISISPDASTINFSATLPPKTSAGGIGYWDIIITNTDGGSFTLPKGFLFDYPEGEVFFYPTYVSPSKINALGTAGQPRIAYSLSADKDVDIYIYDIREAKVVFHRKYAKGQTGGKFGYNEIIWNGITDFGSMIPNGSYILQAFLDGKMLGQTYFTVSE